MKPRVVILGCGYTGRRVAARLAADGCDVIATTRHPERLALPGVRVVRFDAEESLAPLDEIPEGAHVVYSIPVLHPDPAGTIVKALGARPARVVYLSTTGVYGVSVDVNEHTPADPATEEGATRLTVEAAIQSGPWSSLVLRPAAIYGPERGVHMRMRAGTFRLGGDGGNYVSRIHAEDLAEHVVAALFSDVEGAWPVADAAPATSREIAAWCSERMGVPMAESVATETLHHTRRANRRVDGSAIRTRLSVSLRFPSYREGIEAALGDSS